MCEVCDDEADEIPQARRSWIQNGLSIASRIVVPTLAYVMLLSACSWLICALVGIPPVPIRVYALVSVLVMYPPLVHVLMHRSFTLTVDSICSMVLAVPLGTCSRYVQDLRNLELHDTKLLGLKLETPSRGRARYTLRSQWCGVPFTATFALLPVSGGIHSVQACHSALH